MGRRLGAAPFVLLGAAMMPLPTRGGASLLGLPNLCGFRALTGIPCPACGITRSVVCCCHLRLGDAVAYNPVGPLVVGLLLFAAVARFTGAERRLPPNTYEKAVAVILALLLLLWGARLAGSMPAPP